MEETKELALTDEQQEQKFKESIPKYKQFLDMTQIAYLHVALQRKITFDKLQRQELKLQQILNDTEKEVEELSITKLTERLSEYKKEYAILTGIRIKFTNFLREKVIDPSMAFEKRMNWEKNEKKPEEGNKKFFELDKKLFEKRKKQEEENKLAANKQMEAQQYESHIKIQNKLIEQDFYDRAIALIQKTYEDLLKNLVETPDVSVVKLEIAKMTLIEPKKFGEFKYITKDDAWKVFNKVKAEGSLPNRDILVQKVCDEVDQHFMMYSVDLQNIKNKNEKEREKIVEQVSKQFEEKIAAYNEIVQTNIHVEKTYASATPTVKTQPEGKAIKRVVKIVDENTWDWCVRIIDAFRRMPEQQKYLVSRKDWGNLDVHAMADAIGKYSTETGDKYPTLQYKDVEK